MYDGIKKNENVIFMQNKFHVSFIDGALLEIRGNSDTEYYVEFIDFDSGECVYSTYINEGGWAKTSRKWWTNWLIRVTSNGGVVFEHKYDAESKNVLISLESSALGDTVAWVPYAEEFRKKWNCNVYFSTFHNSLFKSEYPNINFISPGMVVHSLYASYRIGWFYEEEVDKSKHKTNFFEIPLQQTATDILGLDFKEIKPNIKKLKPISHEKPYICIANHSTAQTKYWNNPTGWQELVDFVKSNGYDVMILSKEGDNYMGNKNPIGVIEVKNKTLEEIGSILNGSSAFVGIGSGLSWFSWALGVPTILISGFSKPFQEMESDVIRVINENVCNGCFSRYLFDKGDWNWCPDQKGTEKQFECTKSITFDMVKPHIQKILKLS